VEGIAPPSAPDLVVEGAALAGEAEDPQPAIQEAAASAETDRQANRKSIALSVSLVTSPI